MSDAPQPGSVPITELERRSVFRGRIFEVCTERIRLPSGREQDLSIVRHDGAVGIVPLLEDGRLLCVRQYRHAVRQELIEIPAGRMEPGEDPLRTAKRELEEETGYVAGDWSTLFEFFPAPGFCSERMTLFCARNLTPVPGGGLAADPDEELSNVFVTPEELLRTTSDAKTWIAARLILDRQEPQA